MAAKQAAEHVVVLDVGVRGGPHRRWQALGPALEFIGVDADEAECARLSSAAPPRGVRYLPCAVGRSDGLEGTLHITKQPGCSSLLPPNDAFLQPFEYRRAFEVVKTVPVTLTTLDTLCAREGIRPDVLKLDTQGSELDVLIGAEATLPSVCVLETEVEFNPVYLGQPLFGDIDAFLRDRGFGLLGLRRDFWRRSATRVSSAGGTLIHGDALYYRLRVPERQQERFALALAAYRQMDFAEALMGDAGAPRERVTYLQRLVGKALSIWQPHRQLRGWLDHARPAGATDWHDPDFF
jgi:FkbM family methyltransferase